MIEGFQSTGEQVILISSDYEQNITELLATDENYGSLEVYNEYL